MYTILRTDEFDQWLAGLTDHHARARIAARIVSAEFGNLGDCKSVGGSVTEMRVNYGPGYRVYFVRRGKLIYLLLCGGTKQGQSRDIRRARAMARTVEGK